MVRESVGHLKNAGKEVMLDLEHFFDGWKANTEYTMQVRIVDACPWLVLCRRDQCCWEVLLTPKIFTNLVCPECFFLASTKIYHGPLYGA